MTSWSLRSGLAVRCRQITEMSLPHISISLIWEESCSTPGKEHLVSCDAGLDPKESLSYTANFG
jgi:hypothetical protein